MLVVPVLQLLTTLDGLLYSVPVEVSVPVQRDAQNDDDEEVQAGRMSCPSHQKLHHRQALGCSADLDTGVSRG